MTETAIAPELTIATKTTVKRARSFRFVQWLAGVIVIAIFVMTFVVQAFEIPSESMERTLLIGDYLLVNKSSFAHGGHWTALLPYRPLQCGDIIVFRYPVQPSQHFVKRVIGLPGDHIHLVDKRVFVNGQLLKEKYTYYKSNGLDPYRDDFPDTDYFSENIDPHWWIQMRSAIHNGEIVVPPGNYFVLGDNRDESLDSRYWGFVPEENIVGRPLLIYWSINRSDSANVLQDAKLDGLAGFIRRHWGKLRWHRMLVLVK
ncbi:MAG TPA: signal peptidase I [Terriglobales bacterium]|nr:signal peptidase I [Terriglobales bacterium]